MVVLYLNNETYQQVLRAVGQVNADLAERLLIAQEGYCSVCGEYTASNKPKYAVCYRCLYEQQRVNVVYLT